MVSETGIMVVGARGHHVVVGDWFFETAEVAAATAKHTEQADADDHTRDDSKDPHWWQWGAVASKVRYGRNQTAGRHGRSVFFA